jgi:flavin-dependent dehydrogenase
MSEMFDIVIVGAGPAGSTAARCLDSRFSVAVIDPAFSGKARQKPCGGLLSESSQRALAAFGLTLPSGLLVDPQGFAVDVFDLERGSVRTRRYARTYTNLDRRAFDSWLRSLIPDTVGKIAGRVTNVTDEHGGYTLTVRIDGEETQLSCRFLIAADGGGSLMRRLLSPEKKLRTYTAVQEHFHFSDPPRGYACFYDRLSTDACGWSLVKDDVFIVGGAFQKEGSGEAFSAFKARVFAHYGLSDEKPLFREACPVVFPKLFGTVTAGMFRFALAGEAAGLISASSFEGISYAIESGRLLAQALNIKSFDALPAYRRALLPLRLKVFFRVLKAKVLNTPILRRLIMKSKIGSVQPKT